MNALKGLAFTSLGLAMVSTASAQSSYPDRTAVVIVPYSAGGTTDYSGRLIADQLGRELGQTFVVENKPGAGGTLGVTMAAQAEPDGYTLVLSPVGTHSIAPSLYTSLAYDPQEDFEPVVMVQTLANIVVVNNDLPVTSIDELIAYAKAHPGLINMASAGIGTSIHLAGEMFESQVGVDFTHIPYAGSAQAIIAVLSGEADVIFDNIPSALPHVQSGGLRALAVTSAERVPVVADVPTVAEAATSVDLKDYDATTWFALFAPAGTPEEIVTILNQAANRALEKSDVVETIEASGGTPGGGTSEELDQFVLSETEKWRGVIEEAGIERQ